MCAAKNKYGIIRFLPAGETLQFKRCQARISFEARKNFISPVVEGENREGSFEFRDCVVVFIVTFVQQSRVF